MTHRKRPIEEKLVAVAVAVVVLFWFVEPAIDAFLFGEGTYLIRLISPDPNEAWMRSFISIIIIGFGAYAQSAIAKIKRAEAERERLLRETEKMNLELKDFAYIVSHDLKAPLRGISQLAQWVTEDYGEKLDDSGREQLGLLQDRTHRMHYMIEGILQYSRVGRVKKAAETVDTRETVEEVVASLALPEKIRVRVGKGLPEITVDPVQIVQVFQNLIGNAAKFIDKPEGVIEVGCRDLASFWEFYVRDNGPGIEARHFERIFQIFQRLEARDQSEGVGAGLAIVKKIVEQNGGQVSVSSEVGQGSTFRFTVPKNR